MRAAKGVEVNAGAAEPGGLGPCGCNGFLSFGGQVGSSMEWPGRQIAPFHCTFVCHFGTRVFGPAEALGGDRAGGQGFFRIIKNQGGGDPSPKTPSPPPQTKVTIVGKNEIYNRKNLVRPFLVHQVLGPKPPPPLPPPAQKKPWGVVIELLAPGAPGMQEMNGMSVALQMIPCGWSAGSVTFHVLPLRLVCSLCYIPRAAPARGCNVQCPS